MPDISQTLVAKSDQLNGDDLIGGDLTITVRAVKVGAEDQPVAISYEGDKGKPYKPCLSMRRVLAHAWGPHSENWVGRRMTLYRNPSVKFGDLEVGGIRISHLSDLPKAKMQMPLTATRGRKVGYTVERLGDAPSPEPQPEPPALPPEIHDKAELAARQGSVTFREWWKSDESKAHRPGLTRNLAHYQALAAAADAKGAPDQPDPFGQGAPDDPAPADEPREREPGED